MDEDQLATAWQEADPSTADPGKPVDKAALARLEQLAIQELSAARPLAGAGDGASSVDATGAAARRPAGSETASRRVIGG